MILNHKTNHHVRAGNRVVRYKPEHARKLKTDSAKALAKARLDLAKANALPASKLK